MTLHCSNPTSCQIIVEKNADGGSCPFMLVICFAVNAFSMQLSSVCSFLAGFITSIRFSDRMYQDQTQEVSLLNLPNI